MAKLLTEELKQQWKDRINEQRSSSLSISLWCRQNEILVHNFFYWQSKLFPKTIDHSTFTEISEESKATEIIIEYKGFNIHLNQHFDPDTLKRCLEVFKKC
jgi:hypothetical protein